LFDTLFQQCGGVKSEYSRLFFDPERFGDDSFENMHKLHRLGWFYENAILEKKPLRSTKHKHSVRHYFDEHHAQLNQKTKKRLDTFGKCTVIDCHSFSDKRYWFHKQMKLPDICIGFEQNHVDKKIVEAVQDLFMDYTIGINKPYEGSLVPTNYWGKDFRVKSVMIEINKKLYLEADHLTKNSQFKEIQERLNTLYKTIIKV